MYREFFGIEENPFSNTPNPEYIYMSPRHSEALAHLLFGAQAGSGFVLLTGEVGAGKTTLSRYLAEQLDENVKLAICLNPRVSEVDLLALVCEELGVEVTGSTQSIKDLTSSLNIFLLELYGNGGRAVLIIDEAQNLSFELLEQVRMLTNLETTHNKLLQIILIGQPELKEHIDQFKLRQLSQRITARYHLDPMTAEETRKYIVHRSSVAGLSEHTFSTLAMSEICKYSRGIPRLINSICERCLLGAYALGQKTVTGALASSAASEVLGHDYFGGQASEQPPRKFAMPFILLVFFGAIALGYILVGQMNIKPPFELPQSVARIMDSVASLSSPSTEAGIDDTESLSMALSYAVDGSGGYKQSFVMLAGMWPATKDMRSEINDCQKAENIGLACLSWEGSLGSAFALNRPLMIGLTSSEGTSRYAVVLAKQDSYVTLQLANRKLRISERIVQSLQTGHILLLWQPPPFFTRSLHQGMSGKDVAWVRRRLIRANTSLPVRVGETDYFGDAMLEELRIFKSTRMLKNNGIIDEATLIHLDNVIGDTIAPVLFQKP